MGMGNWGSIRIESWAMAILLTSSSAMASVEGGNGCSAAQFDALKQADASLTKQVANLASDLPKLDLEYVRKNFILPNHRPWDENSPKNRRYENYLRSMSQGLIRLNADLREGVKVTCRHAKLDPNCRGGEVLAYVLFRGNTPLKNLYFCSGFFDQTEAQKESTFFHELTHYTLATEDRGLDWLEGQATNISTAPKDAYHWEAFVNSDVESSLKRQIWYWNWPKK